jgi:hypothetical protein
MTDFVDNTVDPYLAKTKACYTSIDGAMYNFRIAISDDYLTKNSKETSFYTGTATSWATKQYDLWGALTHEFGHATGRMQLAPHTEDGHFEDSDTSACPPPVNGMPSEAQSTMCEELNIGTSKWRTLTSHDISSFNDVPNYG